MFSFSSYWNYPSPLRESSFLLTLSSQFIVAAEEQGVKPEQLAGTIQVYFQFSGLSFEFYMIEGAG